MENLFSESDNYYNYLKTVVLQNEEIKLKIKQNYKSFIYEYLTLIILPNLNFQVYFIRKNSQHLFHSNFKNGPSEAPDLH